MAEANITTDEIAGTVPDKKIKVAHISGQLDESNIDEKIQTLYKLLEDNPQGLNLILDMENLDYMNSKSIGYLTDIYGKVAQNGGQVLIAKTKPNIADILQVVGLTQLIKTFNSVEEAVASVAVASGASNLAPAPVSFPVPISSPASLDQHPPVASAAEAPSSLDQQPLATPTQPPVASAASNLSPAPSPTTPPTPPANQ
ncbi:anti-sigma factor antagonist [Candidatus Peregrinibacteria bacterium]|nr:anti-sigma factor antagonist [Candidatus Peregrinibacteria bacterium]